MSADAHAVADGVSELDPELEDSLRDCATALGKAWFETWRVALRREGRALAGGFPGTVAEARARVLQHLAPLLRRRAGERGAPFPSHERIARVSSEVYAAARRAWTAEAVPGGRE